MYGCRCVSSVWSVRFPGCYLLYLIKVSVCVCVDADVGVCVCVCETRETKVPSPVVPGEHKHSEKKLWLGALTLFTLLCLVSWKEGKGFQVPWSAAHPSFPLVRLAILVS